MEPADPLPGPHTDGHPPAPDRATTSTSDTPGRTDVSAVTQATGPAGARRAPDTPHRPAPAARAATLLGPVALLLLLVGAALRSVDGGAAPAVGTSAGGLAVVAAVTTVLGVRRSTPRGRRGAGAVGVALLCAEATLLLAVLLALATWLPG